jgi:hypothetical protein
VGTRIVRLERIVRRLQPPQFGAIGEEHTRRKAAPESVHGARHTCCANSIFGLEIEQLGRLELSSPADPFHRETAFRFRIQSRAIRPNVPGPGILPIWCGRKESQERQEM